METAEALFRRLGFAKTAVADIAAELKMSPANVYRFFPSKNAIVEAICQRCLGELEDKAWAVARSRGPAAERIERLFLEILAYHKENLLTDQRVNDIVLVAHRAQLGRHPRPQGGHPHGGRKDPARRHRGAASSSRSIRRETARLMMRSLVHFCHPVLLAQCLQDGEDVEAGARASVRFLLRAITPRS